MTKAEMDRAREAFETFTKLTNAVRGTDGRYVNGILNGWLKCFIAGAEWQASQSAGEGWISVDEKLPEMREVYKNSPLSSERVLVTGGGQVDISRYSETYKRRIARWENTWLLWTHWRPLPSPPKENKKS